MAGVSAYHSTDPCTDDGEHAAPDADAGTSIPVVDFDALVNGETEQRAQAVRDVGRACQDWGFFMVANHGVPEDLKEAFMEASEELFTSPSSSDKAAYLEADPMAPIRVGSGFYAAVDGARYWRDYFKMFAHPELHCPANHAKLREVAATTRRLLLTLATAVSESLGLAAGHVSEALRLESCFQILVANHYPPCIAADPGDGGGDVGAALGLSMPAQSDHGFLTLLFQNGVDGLQVHHGGRWLLATPLPGTFFVIAGDQLEIVSNGRYKGVLHRAVVGGERARMSVVSMIAPCLDAVVEPVPELAADGQGLEFRGVRYRDYMEHQQSNKLDRKAALDIARVHRVVTRTEN